MNSKRFTLPSLCIGILSASVLLLHADPETPTNTLPLPHLQTPGVKELVDASRVSLEQIDKDRIAALSSLLNRHLGVVTDMLAEKKKSRNVGGIAAATTGISMYQSALTNLVANGKLDLPDKVRRELEPGFSQCKSEAATIETAASGKKKALMDAALEKFTAIAIAANPAMDAAAKASLEAHLTDLLKVSTTPPVSTPDPSAVATNAASTTNATAVSTNAPAAPLPDVLASSGEAEQWATVASWRGAMMGMDIVSIPLAEAQPGTNATRQFNPITSQDSELSYIVHHRLTPQEGVLYRLKRVDNTHGVDLLEWPSVKNKFQLVVRTKTTGEFPAHHAFDLQVSFPGGDLSKVVEGAVIEGPAKPKTPPPVVITLITVPQGATIYIDDVLQAKLRTSCRFPLSQGNYSLRLVLPGYTPISITNQAFTSNCTLRLMFQPDSRIQRKTIAVLANSPSWSPSDVSVEKGDTLVLRADGQWSCTPGHEQCNAAGYPNNETFYRYYMDSASYPRHTASAGYGALVMRIGKTGNILPLGKDFASSRELRFGAPESGPVFFDINEKDEPKYRADNNGTLILNLTVIPSKPADPAR